jgi:hypothetical protein
MEFNSLNQGHNVQSSLLELNKLLKEISATPEIWADELTRDELNSKTLALYFKALRTTELILETREHINEYKKNAI